MSEDVPVVPNQTIFDRPPPKAPEVGTWNHLEASIGQRGMGKSTWQCKRVLDLSREAGGAYVIGHSLGARLPLKLPKELGGEVLPITYHESIARLERGLRSKPDRWHILAPPLPGESSLSGRRDTADDLLLFATRFSSALRKAAWNKLHPLKWWKPNVDMTGVRATPIIVIVDEGIAVEAAGPSRKDTNKWFLEFLFSLRHLHVALLWAIQDASARSWRVLEQANEIYAFSIRHAWALQNIQAAGATPEEIDRIRTLPPHEHVRISFSAPATAAPIVTDDAKPK